MISKKYILNLFVSTTCFKDNTDVNIALKKLNSIKFTRVEIGSNHSSLKQNNLKLYPKTEYIIHNYFPAAFNDFVLNIASEKSILREKSINFIKSTIRLCSKKGIKYYTIHPGFLGTANINIHKIIKDRRNFDFDFTKADTKKSSRKDIINEVINVINELYKYSKRHNVSLLIENQGSSTSKDNILFDNIDEITKLQKTVGHMFKLNFNVAHALLSGQKIGNISLLKKYLNYAVFVEISEIQGKYDSHLPIINPEGRVYKLLKKYRDEFNQKNLIMEYRNTNLDKVNKSSKFIKSTLNIPANS